MSHLNKAAAATACLAVALALLSACGGSSPTASSGPRLPLRPGPQLLSITGFDFVTDVGLSPCTPIGVPRAGKVVHTLMTLELSGGEWIARPAAGQGNLELRIPDAVSGILPAQAVQGTVRGETRDGPFGDILVGTNVHVLIESANGSAAAALEGGTQGTLGLVIGRITGKITFSDTEGQTASCTSVFWMMQPQG